MLQKKNTSIKVSDLKKKIQLFKDSRLLQYYAASLSKYFRRFERSSAIIFKVNITEDWNLQQHIFKNLKSRTY